MEDRQVAALEQLDEVELEGQEPALAAALADRAFADAARDPGPAARESANTPGRFCAKPGSRMPRLKS